MKVKNHKAHPRLFNNFFVLLFGTLLFLLVPQISFAQFTYIGASTGFKNNLIGPSQGVGSETNRTTNYGIFLNVKVVHRPLRYFGIGAGFTLPLAQGNGNNSYDIREYFQYYTGNELRDFEYTAKQAFNLTAIASLFADTDANFHADFRLSYVSFKEEFEFESYGEKVNYMEKTNFPAVGFALGFMPHLTRHLFFDINMGFDFWLIGSDSGFSYDVEYDWNPEYGFRFVTLESQISGVKPSFFMNIGLGYYF